MSDRVRIVTRTEKAFEVGVGDYVQVGGTPHLYCVSELFPRDKCRPIRLEEEVPYQDVKRHGMTFFPSVKRITGVRHSRISAPKVHAGPSTLVDAAESLQDARLSSLEAHVTDLANMVASLASILNKGG